jgi:hypothetical protein
MHRAVRRLAILLVAPALAAAVAACDVQSSSAPGAGVHAGPGSGEPAATHHHVAPHGGSLVELEHEALNLELLVDPSTGTMTAWVLDGECENAIRIPQETIDLTLALSGTAVAVRLDAVENPLTGEKKGDTSQFRGAHDGLRGAGEFDGAVRSVKVGPRAFGNVKFRYARSPK